jgi:hypothetical protein
MNNLLELNQPKLSVIEECYLQQFITEEQNLSGFDIQAFRDNVTSVGINDLPSELPQ